MEIECKNNFYCNFIKKKKKFIKIELKVGLKI